MWPVFVDGGLAPRGTLLYNAEVVRFSRIQVLVRFAGCDFVDLVEFFRLGSGVPGGSGASSHRDVFYQRSEFLQRASTDVDPGIPVKSMPMLFVPQISYHISKSAYLVLPGG